MTRTSLVLAAVLSASSAAAGATTIERWNLGNVDVVEDPALPGTGSSIIYDRDITSGTTGAISNGFIGYVDEPGLTVLNDAPDLNPGQSIPDCILAPGATCEGPFQSGKRIKMSATSVGAIDLQFDTLGDAESNSYQVFHRIINLTPQRLSGFSIELGTGLGDDFVRSGLGDGLSFDLSAQLGPNNAPAFSQFAFGLFGDAAENPNFTLDGFFAAERSGFNLAIGEDLINTGAIYGPYDGLFGPGMLNNDLVPDGYFWDNDGDPNTDALLMAWYNGSVWEQRRIIDPNDPTSALSTAGTIVDESQLIGFGWERLAIEDLRNVNVNFNILTGPNFNADKFTLRFMTTAVPEPASWAMLIAGFGLVGASMRRRRTRQSSVLA